MGIDGVRSNTCSQLFEVTIEDIPSFGIQLDKAPLLTLSLEVIFSCLEDLKENEASNDDDSPEQAEPEND
jgi:hypothetical protein